MSDTTTETPAESIPAAPVTTPAVVTTATPAPTTDPWAEYLAKHPEPQKLEPYKGAKNPIEAFELAQSRLAETQTALRTRQPGLPPRPAEDAPPEAHSAWRAAHGIPEAPEGYGLTRPESVPAEVWNEAEARAFEQWAHKEGLSPDLVKKLQQFDVDRQHGMASTHQQQQAQAAEQLRISEAQELGKRFGDKLDGTLKDLQTWEQASGGDPNIFDPNSPKFWGVEAVDKFHKLLALVPRGEDGTARNMGAASANGAYDKAWAKAALVSTHPDYAALNDPKHPRHEEMTRLRNQAYALAQKA